MVRFFSKHTYLLILAFCFFPLAAEEQKRWSILGGFSYGLGFENNYESPLKGGGSASFASWEGRSYSYGFHAERRWRENHLAFMFGLSGVYYDYEKQDRGLARELGLNSASFMDFIFIYHILPEYTLFSPYLGMGIGIGHSGYPERFVFRQLIKAGGRIHFESGFLFTELQYEQVTSRQNEKTRDAIRAMLLRIGYGLNL